MEKNFDNFLATLKPSIKTWEYFVNWEKVFGNQSELEISLNNLNYLLGKEDFKTHFTILYKSHPDILKAMPILLAIRDKKIDVYQLEKNTNTNFDFTKDGESIDKYYHFIEQSGLLSFFQNEKVKNLVDYVLGVEVGLDSNGRKNRSGSIMESIVEKYIVAYCAKNNLEYMSQATSSKIKKKWSVDLNIEKKRIFDFAICKTQTKEIKLFEVNFYNSGGSKAKAVCGEFMILNDALKRLEIDFIWLADGFGWKATKNELRSTYENNDYIFNLSMLEVGILDELQWLKNEN